MTERMHLIVDTRDRALLPLLRLIDPNEQYYTTELKQITIGDVQITGKQLDVGGSKIDGLVIERKRADDLVQSIQEGRIFDQMLRMTQSDMIPYLIIVGTIEEWMPQWNKWSNQRAIADSSLVYGAIGSAFTRYGISCAWVPDDMSLCKIVAKMARNVSENKLALPSRIQMTLRNRDKRLDYLKVLYGISEAQAKSLMGKGKTLVGAMSLPMSQLIDIPGIGEITAKKIVELSTKEVPYQI